MTFIEGVKHRTLHFCCRLLVSQSWCHVSDRWIGFP